MDEDKKVDALSEQGGLTHAGSGLPRAPEQEGVTVRVEWDDPQMPIAFANAIGSQVDELGDIVLMIGQIMPPPIPEDESQRQMVMQKFRTDPTIVGHLLGRYAMSPERVRKMIEELEAALRLRDNYLKSKKRQEGSA